MWTIISNNKQDKQDYWEITLSNKEDYLTKHPPTTTLLSKQQDCLGITLSSSRQVYLGTARHRADCWGITQGWLSSEPTTLSNPFPPLLLPTLSREAYSGTTLPDSNLNNPLADCSAVIRVLLLSSHRQEEDCSVTLASTSLLLVPLPLVCSALISNPNRLSNPPVLSSEVFSNNPSRLLVCLQLITSSPPLSSAIKIKTNLPILSASILPNLCLIIKLRCLRIVLVYSLNNLLCLTIRLIKPPIIPINKVSTIFKI